MDLEAAVMNMRFLLSRWKGDQEKGVVIDKFVASVDVGEHSNILLIAGIISV